MIQVDFGELYAYTAVDICTREAQLVLLPGLTSRDGRKALEIVMAYFDSCEVLQTDEGKEFGVSFPAGSCREREGRLLGSASPCSQALSQARQVSLRETDKPLWRAFTAPCAPNRSP